MIIIRRLAVVLVGLAVNAGWADAHADFINGSFETGNYTFNSSGGDNLELGSTAITGWTTIGGQLTVIENTNNFGVSSPFGDKFLDLTGTNDNPPYGGVEQSVGTVIGQSYLVSLDLGVNPTHGYYGPVSVLVSAGGSSATLTANPSGTGDLWTLETFSFVATSDSSLVSILGSSTANGAYLGLDNVSIVGPASVPEPASLVMLGIGGLGVIGFARYRRARS